MTDVKRLLKGADLPWWTSNTETEHSRRIYAHTDGVNLATTWWDGNPHPTAELIVHAVNHLPDYEAAVDALDDVAALLELRVPSRGSEDDIGFDEEHEVLENARAALARLRGRVAADV